MRFVEKALTNPGRCAVLPYLGGNHPEGYLDTGSELVNGGDGRWDHHVYISRVACREIANLVGWVDPTELQARVVELEARVEAAEAEVNESRRTLDAIDLMESAGFTSRRKTGRPSKQPVEA